MFMPDAVVLSQKPRFAPASEAAKIENRINSTKGEPCISLFHIKAHCPKIWGEYFKLSRTKWLDNHSPGTIGFVSNV
jgi:hypothetical protein